MNYSRLVRRFRNDERIWDTDPGDGSKFRRVFTEVLDHVGAERRQEVAALNAADPLRNIDRSWLCRTDFY